MSLPEIISLTCISLGIAALLRFVWLDSMRFADVDGRPAEADPSVVSRRTVRRLALEAEAARVRAENDSLPWAA